MIGLPKLSDSIFCIFFCVAVISGPKVVTDKKGFVSIDIGSYGIPESILIDKNKIIIFKFIGPLSFKDYKKIINIISKKEWWNITF